MEYMQPNAEIIIFKQEDVLTVSQEKEDIWSDFNA